MYCQRGRPRVCSFRGEKVFGGFCNLFGGWRYSLRPNFVRHETLLCTLSLTMTYHRKSVSRQPGELLKFYEDTHLPIKALRLLNPQCAFAWLKFSIQPYFWFGKGLTSQTGCHQSLLLSVCSQDINFKVKSNWCSKQFSSKPKLPSTKRKT